MKATIKSIAEQTNVSIATVSMVLNKKDKRISEKTRQKILAAAAELNYQPNVIARSLVMDETKTVGLLLPDVANPFFAEIAKCIETRLSLENYNVFLCNSNNNRKKEQTYLSELLSRKIDGLIISSVNAAELIIKNKLQHTPVVIFDRTMQTQEFYSVSVQDNKGGILAAKEFLKNGHKNFACISGSLKHTNIKARVDGFKETLALHHNEIKIMVETEMTIQCGYEKTKKLIEKFKKENITALFCTNDLIALGVYKAFKEMGIHIPADISIIGFDNIAYAAYLTPPLTTIEQPLPFIGKKTAEMLLNIMRDANYQPKNYVFPVRLLRRNSVSSL